MSEQESRGTVDMSDIKIEVELDTTAGKHTVVIYDHDIENLAETIAKKNGFEGQEGRFWPSFSPQIKKVEVQP